MVAGGDRECAYLAGLRGVFYRLSVKSSQELEYLLIHIDLALARVGIHKAVLTATAELCLGRESFIFNVYGVLLPLEPLIYALKRSVVESIEGVKLGIKSALATNVAL